MNWVHNSHWKLWQLWQLSALFLEKRKLTTLFSPEISQPALFRCWKKHCIHSIAQEVLHQFAGDRGSGNSTSIRLDIWVDRSFKDRWGGELWLMYALLIDGKGATRISAYSQNILAGKPSSTLALLHLILCSFFHIIDCVPQIMVVYIHHFVFFSETVCVIYLLYLS